MDAHRIAAAIRGWLPAVALKRAVALGSFAMQVFAYVWKPPNTCRVRLCLVQGHAVATAHTVEIPSDVPLAPALAAQLADRFRIQPREAVLIWQGHPVPTRSVGGRGSGAAGSGSAATGAPSAQTLFLPASCDVFVVRKTQWSSTRREVARLGLATSTRSNAGTVSGIRKQATSKVRGMRTDPYTYLSPPRNARGTAEGAEEEDQAGFHSGGGARGSSGRVRLPAHNSESKVASGGRRGGVPRLRGGGRNLGGTGTGTGPGSGSGSGSGSRLVASPVKKNGPVDLSAVDGLPSARSAADYGNRYQGGDGDRGRDGSGEETSRARARRGASHGSATGVSSGYGQQGKSSPNRWKKMRKVDALAQAQAHKEKGEGEDSRGGTGGASAGGSAAERRKRGAGGRGRGSSRLAGAGASVVGGAGEKHGNAMHLKH